MLDLNVTIEGDKVVIHNLQQFAADLPEPVQRGLYRSVKGMHRVAFDFLSGEGGRGKKKRLTGPVRRTGFTKKDGEQVDFSLFQGAGGYPVPVRTGNLRRLLDFVEPGQSKGEFAAGPMEAILYDSALYARLIHDAEGSSAKFGPRPYLTDALKKFDEGGKIMANIEEAIAAEITKRGLRG